MGDIITPVISDLCLIGYLIIIMILYYILPLTLTSLSNVTLDLTLAFGDNKKILNKKMLVYITT